MDIEERLNRISERYPLFEIFRTYDFQSGEIRGWKFIGDGSGADSSEIEADTFMELIQKVENTCSQV